MTPQEVIKKFMASLDNQNFTVETATAKNMLNAAVANSSKFSTVQEVIDAMKADQIAAEKIAVEEILGKDYAGKTMADISEDILSANASTYDTENKGNAYGNEWNDRRSTVERLIKERKAYIFLEKYCGIQLENNFWITNEDAITSWSGQTTGNTDTGAITGSDANITLNAGSEYSTYQLIELKKLYGDKATLSEDYKTLVIGTGKYKNAETVVPETLVNTYTATTATGQNITTGNRDWIVKATDDNDTINSGGADSINAGAGNDEINIAGDGATVTSGDGNDQIKISADVKRVTVTDLSANDEITISGTFEIGSAKIEDMQLVITDSTGTRKISLGDFENAVSGKINIGGTSKTISDWLTANGFNLDTLKTNKTDYADEFLKMIGATPSGNVAAESNERDGETEYTPFKVGDTDIDTGAAGDVAINDENVGTLSTSYPNASTFTRKGLTIHLLGEGDSSGDWESITAKTFDELNDTEKSIIAALFKWWGSETLNLNEESYGIGFDVGNPTVTDIGLYFYTGSNNGTLATVWNWCDQISGEGIELTLNVNLGYYANALAENDVNGISSSNSEGYLDRTLAHEMTHAVMAANVLFFNELPKFIKEGLAELTHGIDDKRGNVIFEIAYDAEELDASLDLTDTGTGSQEKGNGYAGGYMFMRYFAKQAALKDIENELTSITEFNGTATIDFSSLGNLVAGNIIYIDATQDNPTANVAADTDAYLALDNKYHIVGEIVSDGTSLYYKIDNETIKQNITSGGNVNKVLNLNSNSTFTGSDSDDFINIIGNNTKVNTDGGYDEVQITGSNAEINSGADNDIVIILEGNDNVINLGDGDVNAIQFKGKLNLYNLDDSTGQAITTTEFYRNNITGGSGADVVTDDLRVCYVDADGNEYTNSIYYEDFTPLEVIDTDINKNYYYVVLKENSTTEIEYIVPVAPVQYIQGVYDSQMNLGDGTNQVNLFYLGNSTITTGADNDTITVSQMENVSIDAGAGEDIIAFYSGGSNEIETGANDDIVIFGTVNIDNSINVTGFSAINNNRIDLGSGDDQIYFAGKGNSINGGAGDDNVTEIEGGEGGNTFIYDSDDFGTDIIIGFMSNDVIKITGDYSYKILDSSDANYDQDYTTIKITKGNVEQGTIKITMASNAIFNAATNIETSTFDFLASLEKDTDGAYLIKTAENLQTLATYVNGGKDCDGLTFKLTDNIDFSNVTDFKAIGTNNNPFKGTFDGNGKTVSNNGGGLFEYIGDGAKLIYSDSKTLEVKNGKVQLTHENGVLKNVSEINAGETVTYNDKTLTVTGSGAEVSATYDSDGKITTVSGIDSGETVSYGDESIRVTRGTVTATFDSNGKIKAVSNTGDTAAFIYQKQALTITGAFTANFDSNGNLESVNDLANGASVVYQNKSYSHTINLPSGVTATCDNTLKINGKIYYADGSTITISKFGADKEISFDSGITSLTKDNGNIIAKATADGNAIFTISGLGTLSDSTPDTWSVSGTSASYGTAITKGAKIDGVKIIYQPDDFNISFTLNNLADNVTAEDLNDAVSVKGTEITFNSDTVLDSSKVVNAPTGYTLKLGSNVTTTPVKVEGSFSAVSKGTATFKTSYYEGYYKEDTAGIIYISPTTAKTITISNLKTDNTVETVEAGIEVKEESGGSYKITFKNAEILDDKAPTITADAGINYTVEVEESLKPSELSPAWKIDGITAILRAGMDKGYTVENNKVIYNDIIEDAALMEIKGITTNAQIDAPDGKVAVINANALTYDASIKSNEGNYSVKIVGDMKGKTFSGTEYADTMEITASNAVINSGAGVDNIKVSGDNVTVNAGYDSDTVSLTGSKAVVVFGNGYGADIVYGYSNDTTIKVNGDSYTTVESGNDVLINIGNSSMRLIDAKDKTLNIDQVRTAEFFQNGITASGNVLKVSNKFEDSQIYLGEYPEKFYKLNASAVEQDLKIIGTERAESIKGGKGNDEIYGGGNNDTLRGDLGNDIFYYSGGDDYIADYTPGQDTIKINFSDIISSTLKGSDAVLTIKEKGTLTIKSAKNKIITFIDDDGKTTERIFFADTSYSPLEEGLNYNNARNTLTLDEKYNDQNLKLEDYLATVSKVNISRAKQAINVEGSTRADSIIGSEYNDTLSGGAGDDLIKGGNGNDSISGGTGKNTLTGGAGNDVFIYAGGDDFISDYTAGEDQIKLNFSAVQNSTLDGSTLKLTTAEGTLSVKSAKNKVITFVDDRGIITEKLFYADMSYDPLETGLSYNSSKTKLAIDKDFKGNKVDLSEYLSTVTKVDASQSEQNLRIVGNDLGDTLTGGIGNDTIYGGDKNDAIKGGAGDDKIYGGSGNDSLKGEDGNDVIYGGLGDDTLTGGAGYDVFIYEGGNDIITDYAAGDEISIKGTVTEQTYKGKDVILKIGNDTLTVKKGKGKEIFVTDSSNKTNVYSKAVDLLYDNNFVADEFALDDISESKYEVEQIETSDNDDSISGADSIVSASNFDK